MQIFKFWDKDSNNLPFKHHGPCIFFTIQQNFQILLKTNHSPSTFVKMTKLPSEFFQPGWKWNIIKQFLSQKHMLCWFFYCLLNTMKSFCSDQSFLFLFWIKTNIMGLLWFLKKIKKKKTFAARKFSCFWQNWTEYE